MIRRILAILKRFGALVDKNIFIFIILLLTLLIDRVYVDFGIDFVANFKQSGMCQILMSGTLMSVFAHNVPHDGGPYVLRCTFSYTYGMSVLNTVTFCAAVGLYSLINTGLAWVTVSIICTIMSPFIYGDIGWLNSTIFKKKKKTKQEIDRYINHGLGLKILTILTIIFIIIPPVN